MISPGKSKSHVESARGCKRGEKSLQNACILFLVRSSLADVENFRKSLGLLKRYFWDAYPYPIIAFIEQEFLDTWQSEILSIGMAVEFVVLKFEIPSHLQPETVPEKVHDFGLGYRHMCHFFSMGVYEHPRLESFEYYWRLDTDSYLLGPVPYDVFALMHEEAFLYGHINTLEEVQDQADVVEGLWEATLDYARERQLPTDALQELCDAQGIWRRGIYYTNFEISRFDWWRSELVQGYLEFLNQRGGIYLQRWGDAPIHTLAVTLLAPPSKVHLFTEIEYQHQDVVIRFEAEAEPWSAPEQLFENQSGNKQCLLVVDPGGSRRLTSDAENSQPGNGWLNWQPSNFGSGLGDRLRSIASMMVVAELQGKLLRMFWLPNQYCPGNVMEVLESAELEIIADQEEWDRLTTGQEKETGFMLHHTMDNVWEAQGGNLQARGETSHSMNGRWQRMIRRIRINQQLVRKVDGLRRAWGQGRILGVHIRRTDVLQDAGKPINAANAAAYDAALLEKARERAASGLIDGFFLACDNAISAAAWKELLEPLGLPVFHHQKTWRPDHLRQTSLEDTVVDLCLLSRCDGIIGSVYSSFAWWRRRWGARNMRPCHRHLI